MNFHSSHLTTIKTEQKKKRKNYYLRLPFAHKTFPSIVWSLGQSTSVYASIDGVDEFFSFFFSFIVFESSLWLWWLLFAYKDGNESVINVYAWTWKMLSPEGMEWNRANVCVVEWVMPCVNTMWMVNANSERVLKVHNFQWFPSFSSPFPLPRSFE